MFNALNIKHGDLRDRVPVSDEFRKNIEALWKATPQAAVDYVKHGGWKIIAEAIDPEFLLGGIKAAACVRLRKREIVYFEYHAERDKEGLFGLRENKVGVLTHYHELTHVMDEQSAPWRTRRKPRCDMNAFHKNYDREYSQLTQDEIDRHHYYLSQKRPKEPCRAARNLYWKRRAIQETRAQLGAEHIVDGGGPISELMPGCAAAVADDIARILPSLTYRRERQPRRFLNEPEL